MLYWVLGNLKARISRQKITGNKMVLCFVKGLMMLTDFEGHMLINQPVAVIDLELALLRLTLFGVQKRTTPSIPQIRMYLMRMYLISTLDAYVRMYGCVRSVCVCVPL